MKLIGIYTATTNRAKCLRCKEPIVKKEGMMRLSGWNSNGYYCYKCSIKQIDKWIEGWKEKKERIKKSNRISEKRKNELKMARML